MINDAPGFDLFINTVQESTEQGKVHTEAKGTLNGVPVTIVFDSNKKWKALEIKEAFEKAIAAYQTSKGVRDDKGAVKKIIKTSLDSKELKNLEIAHPESLKDLFTASITSKTPLSALKKVQKEEKIYTPEEAKSTLQALKEAAASGAESFKLDEETLGILPAMEKFLKNKSVQQEKETSLKDEFRSYLLQLDKSKVKQKANEVAFLVMMPDAKITEKETLEIITATRKAIEKDIYLLSKQEGQALTIRHVIEALNQLPAPTPKVKEQLDSLLNVFSEFSDKHLNVDSLVKAYLNRSKDEEVARIVRDRANATGVKNYDEFFVTNYNKPNEEGKILIETGPLLSFLDKIKSESSSEEEKRLIALKIQAIMVKSGMFYPAGGF